MFGFVCFNVVLATVTPVVAGHPPEEPDHGVNGSSFWDLWSGDEERQIADSDNVSAPRALRITTDVPLDKPPAAAETWNRRDIAEMPATDRSTAIHPTGATRTDGTYLKDVGVAIAGITPSTKALLSERQQPLYVPPNGTVFGTVDYRVAIPDETDTPTRRTEWNVTGHEVQSVTLLMDGEPVKNTTTDNVVRIAYRNQSKNATGSQSLTLRATATVQLMETVYREKTVCRPVNGNRTCRDWWTKHVETHNETVTVEQTRQVSVYNPELSGYRTTYPNGDTGVVVFRSHPWYGLHLPAGGIRGSWRFYVARDQQWDTLVETDEETTTTRHSPVHPVQVHAYPIRTETTQDAYRDITVLDSYGREFQAPDLSSSVALDSIQGTYVGSFGIAARAPSRDRDQSVRATGLVRGSQTRLSSDSTATIPVNKSEINLTIQNTTANTVTVEVTLKDAKTGVPIATVSRDGYIQLDGQRINTTANGTVQTTIPRQGDAITATYKPDDWWRTVPGYVSDSETVHVGGTVLRYVHLLFTLGVQVGTLLLAGFLIDRITGWGFWPPWRNL
ncbi:hypothetical protein Harman_00080 [Haloarcula mannanilytica]|uniref:Uncharacterized protein n=2 Tax=Haloarcula mannanilytica TaxID=2509225 RepID=A0A4C2EHI3_9EURY|nr:hypothetical protein Harman_00080 [Haloarcula mannanilytica]